MGEIASEEGGPNDGLVLALYSPYAPVHPLLLLQDAAAPPSGVPPGGRPVTDGWANGARSKGGSGSRFTVWCPQALAEMLTCPICLEASLAAAPRCARSEGVAQQRAFSHSPGRGWWVCV